MRQTIVDPQTLAELVARDGGHPEIVAFQESLGVPLVPLPIHPNVWDLIADAVDSTGGFLTGGYLVPHELELGDDRSSWDSKFHERQAVAKYDDFARLICNGPWNSIIGLKDVISRAAKSHPRLEDFWIDVDGNGTDIVDFLSYPVGQARRYGTGWIFLDRERALQNRAVDLASPPWAYCVPTRNVLWWEFSKSGALEALVYARPDDAENDYDAEHPPLMIWTRAAWSIWRASGDSDHPYGTMPTEAGPNLLGEIPAVPLFDEDPAPGHGLGSSNLLGTAIKARDVYNRDSEIREIERRVACPVLSVSVKDLEDVAELKIGTNAILGFTGTVAPAWIEPQLNSITALRSEGDKAKEAAFVDAEMAGIVGHTTAPVQTTSGFHSEVELDKTERRVARFAASVEAAENKLARLFLQFVGEEDVDYSISYPRKFGMTDIDRVIDRTRKRLDIASGKESVLEVFKDYFAALYPRLTSDEVEALAQKETDAREAQKAADQKAAADQAAVAGATARGRLKALRGGAAGA